MRPYQKCQARAWKDYHKLECKLYARLQPRILPSLPRAIIRLLKQQKAGLVSHADWTGLLDLQSHYDDFIRAGGEVWENLSIMSQGIKGYCGTDHSLDMILRLVCMV
jgi:hypothetical protein